MDDSGDPKVRDTKVEAKKGQFNIGISDCVLIKGEGLRRKMEDGGGVEMMANVMWLSTELDVKNRDKRNGPSYDLIPPPSMNGRAKLLSLQKFNEEYPAGVHKRSKEYGKVFVYRRGCNPRTATYTSEFVWGGYRRPGRRMLPRLGEIVYHGTKPAAAAAAGQRRAKKHKAGGSGDGEVDQDRRTKAPRTHSNQRKSSSLATPAVIVKKPFLFTPLSTRILSPETHMATLYALARYRLHVSTLLPSLPCCETELTKETGSCIYISGIPGTGKTTTVREVTTQLQYLVTLKELDDCIFVEINGMKVTVVHQAYSLLWEAIKGDRVNPSQALGLVEPEFSTPTPRSVTCVVLMDEPDLLVTRSQGVMYNLVNWPGGRHSKLIVLTVANAMDLPERTLSNKISSRLGNMANSNAVQFVSQKAAPVSGGARRVLDIRRRAIEVSDTISPSNATSTTLKAGSRVTIAAIFIIALLLRSRRSGVGEGVLRDVLNEAERIVRAQGVAVEELGVVGVEKKGGGGRRVRFLIGGEEAKAALREDGM
ncbi:hypothetical protein L873DRAFT_1839325 [Choiromyces venosus 120613-1]|uniref:Origin recognition complex subunit 1 n=1 Tax=Choiromyces venosus 120613-1 TaxID=1336337 RepID=A0A3N4ISJ8_9PEZI|nr:hypothetical protein L873DRAFT_1839325 [Choiromyces venosus 120613-1]